MNYIGIDLHRRYFVAHVEDEQGRKIHSGRYDNSQAEVALLLEKVKKPVKAVVEATRNWVWLVRALEDQGCQVVMAHPFRTKAIASGKIKTDKIDAAVLCQLLRADLIPQAYIAKREEINNRELARSRIALVKQRTKLKNMILALLSKENLNFSGSDLFGRSGREWLQQQEKHLSPEKRLIINSYLRLIGEINQEIKQIEGVIKEKSSGLPPVKLLLSFPGLGITTAFLLAAEIGSIERFNNAQSFASYFGLVPRLHQSGNHQYYGRITKIGNPSVRWALVQTAHRLVRMVPYWRRWRDRLAYRAGKKKATVALARRIATIIYAMLKTNQPYDPRRLNNHQYQRLELTELKVKEPEG